MRDYGILMTSSMLASIEFILFGALYATIGGVVVRWRGYRETILRVLIAYTAIPTLWQFAEGFGRLGWAPNALKSNLAWVSIFAIPLLSILFLYLSRLFLRADGVRWQWWAIGGVPLSLLVAIAGGLIPIPLTAQIGSLIITRQGIGAAVSIVGWIGVTVGAGVITTQAYRQANQPLHRNRIIYWSFVIALNVAGDMLLFANRISLGGGIRLLATLFAAYLVTTHRLLDVRQITRWILAYLIVSIIATNIYFAGLAGLSYLFRTTLEYGQWVAIAATAATLALIITPLLRFIHQWVDRLISGAGYNPGRAVREYGASISNILDIERLAAKVISLISETMNSRHVRLFLVDHARTGDDSAALFRLRGVKVEGQDEAPAGTLSADNPAAAYLRQEGRPLAQYDIDLLPRYRKMPDAERAWLTSLRMDVYVPIYAKGDWIGLLALGPKATGDRYFDDDMNLLDTLADQTAIALENARLVADLVQLNKDLQQAYADLEKANKHLKELDNLKSQFIGAITHELRTPVANIQFSVQLMEKYGIDHLLPEQREQLQQLLGAAQHAKVMVDNLVAFATFIGKQGELKLEQFSFSEVLGETLLTLEPQANRKGINLRADVVDPSAVSSVSPALIPAEQSPFPPITGDRERLADAVYHLMHNAIKFTEKDGNVVVRCWAKDDKLHFEVKDTGVGVPPEQLPALWEGFAQIADPVKRGVEGLGLGLALVKYVVTAHDGEVYAESQQGVGSTFGFRVPLAGPKPRVVLTRDLGDTMPMETAQ